MFDFLKPVSLKKARAKLLLENGLTLEEKVWLGNLQPKIHRKERSYLAKGGEHYLRVGLSALRCIKETIAIAECSEPESILDFPCGYGRVLRFLKVGYPNSRICGLELDPQAIRFCRKVFTIEAFESQKDFDGLQLPSSFDLIWCGSLITHLDESQTRNLLQFFYRHLNPAGLCIFTTHGKAVEQFLLSGQLTYSLSPDLIERVTSQFQQEGFGFTEYEPARDGYGFSLIGDEKLRQIATAAGDWKCIKHAPKGWDNHQDVYSYRKHS